MPQYFKVTNTCRSRATRDVRKRNATSEGLTQYLGGHYRLVRGSPLQLTAQQLMPLLPELIKRKGQGLLNVTTMQDVEVQLDESLAPLGKLPVTPPLPNPPLDSVSRDYPPPVSAMEAQPGSLPITDQSEFKMPQSVGVDVPIEVEPPAPIMPATEPSPSMDEPVDEPVEPAAETETAKDETKPGRRRRGR